MVWGGGDHFTHGTLGKMLEKQSMLLYHNIKGALKTKLNFNWILAYFWLINLFNMNLSSWVQLINHQELQNIDRVLPCVKKNVTLHTNWLHEKKKKKNFLLLIPLIPFILFLLLLLTIYNWRQLFLICWVSSNK